MAPAAHRAPLVALLAVALVLGGCGNLKTYRVPSSAMEPTIHCARPQAGCLAEREDRIVVDTTKRTPRRGDIIVFHVPPLGASRCGTAGTYVKRVVALPNERVEERQGVVYVDGKRLAEPYIVESRRDFQSFEQRRVGSGEYFVMGDNRAASCDSRVWGALSGNRIVGTVVKIKHG